MGSFACPPARFMIKIDGELEKMEWCSWDIACIVGLAAVARRETACGFL